MKLLRTSADPHQNSLSSARSAQTLPSRELAEQLHLTACSVCLRVLRGTEWVDPERAIRELRSYERQAAPRFEPALCSVCAKSIHRQRLEVPRERTGQQSDLSLIDFQSAILQLQDRATERGMLLSRAAA
jgi:hypothetical protein